MPSPIGWSGFSQWTHFAGAFCCVLLAVWTWQRRESGGKMGRMQVFALVVSAAWSVLVIVEGRSSPLALMAETGRNLAWIAALYTMFSRDDEAHSLRPIRLVIAALAFVELLQPALLVMRLRFEGVAAVDGMILQLSTMFRLLVAIGALVLVHNLYARSIAQQRGAMRWTCAALAVMWGYDLNFFTIDYLAGGVPPEMVAMRGAALVAFALLLALGSMREHVPLRLSPSRTVAFQSLSLLVIGIYLLVMIGAAQSLAWFGGGSGRLAQLAFAFATTIACLWLLPSGRLRSWLKVTVAKHLFQHRYDYRAEWLRFTRTIGRAGPDAPPLNERLVKAVADITDSACGLLLVPGECGELVLGARWQWRTADVPAEAMPPSATALLERGSFIIDLDEVRDGIDHDGESAIVPQWLRDDHGAWALVPLLHFERLVGLVALGRPPVARKLDWEDFDLLRVAGQQLASYLAEHAGQAALLEASRFDEFNRRIAFVMHDIKNLASQLSLLSRNAERHAENPAFRADMLVTLHNASEKLNALLTRLSRYGPGGGGKSEAVPVCEAIEAVAARYNVGEDRRVYIADCEPCTILAEREALEQVLQHLVQNALDASAAAMPVFLHASIDGLFARIEVIDSGCGMSAEFVRNRLFKPFVSSKPNGFGIGAFEARELVRAMQGRLDVESREGIGSRFTVRLPLAAAKGMMAPQPGADGDDYERFA
ncbi:MAG: PEP-CTERM system histidine kinase PrsK [Sphingomonadales bacterium]|nr:PEP-CTERM system histidine kinase PrsK [Sphingomonadales bacterium]MDE2570045.1 PEP-CTERM system histidine kinase PrsK [Sphingomonadales bacterium]